MSENLLQEFSDFEAKYSLKDEEKPNINLDSINRENFDMISFFTENFLLNKENLLVNYSKLQEAFNFMHEMQGKTLEEIAISVDSNLDKFVEVSRQFEKIKKPLEEITTTFTNLKKLLSDHKLKCEKSSQYLKDLIGTKEVLEIIETQCNKFQETIIEITIIEDFLKNPSVFGFIYIARLLQKSDKNIEGLYKQNGEKIKALIEKYQLKEVVIKNKNIFLEIIQSSLKETLNSIMKSQEITEEQKENFTRIFICFGLLNENKRCFLKFFYSHFHKKFFFTII